MRTRIAAIERRNYTPSPPVQFQFYLEITKAMNLRSQIRAELWDAVSRAYESGVYSSAILEAIHYLSDVLRERANIDGDGVALVGQALEGDSPRLRINRFQTESEKSEQKGFAQIIRGIYQGIRNPRSHEQFDDTQTNADAIILFINYTLGIVSQAKPPFSLEEWEHRIFDDDFVANTRYAQLITAEVPAKKYNEALIRVFRNKSKGDGEKLKLVFKSLIDRAGDDQITEFLTVVSDELKVTSDDMAVKQTLQILPERLWGRVEESARLRVENKIIRSIQEGKGSEGGRGWLATWAKGFLKYFELKRELTSAFLKKLNGNFDEQDYVSKYFIWELPNIIESKSYVKDYYTEEYIEAICAAATSDFFPSVSLRENLTELRNFPEEWRELIITRLTAIKDSDPEYYQQVVAGKDDIPF